MGRISFQSKGIVKSLKIIQWTNLYRDQLVVSHSEQVNDIEKKSIEAVD